MNQEFTRFCSCSLIPRFWRDGRKSVENEGRTVSAQNRRQRKSSGASVLRQRSQTQRDHLIEHIGEQKPCQGFTLLPLKASVRGTSAF
jgi:hypothetical protein